MSEWVNIRLDSIMDSTNDCRGREIKGFASYFRALIEQNNKIIDLLQDIKCELQKEGIEE